MKNRLTKLNLPVIQIAGQYLQLGQLAISRCIRAILACRKIVGMYGSHATTLYLNNRLGKCF